MDVDKEIAALPEWPKGSPLTCRPDEVTWWHEAEAYAALARLALAREWISSGHISICQYEMTGGRFPCDCGRDALLAALEPPK